MGYNGDLLANAEEVTVVGTLGQQLAIATIGADVRPLPRNQHELELRNRLVRAAVLTSQAQRPIAHHIANRLDVIERAHRRAVAGRRRRRSRR